ncbi:MAG: S24 family peptidase [Candidatus Saccharimonadales bacterium]
MDSLNVLDEAALETGTAVATHKGFPNPAAERGRTPLSLDRLLIRSPSSTYFFRIRGHSWHRLGIFDGDIAVVDRARTPTPGKIVIASTDTGDLVVAKWGEMRLENLWGVITAIVHEL